MKQANPVLVVRGLTRVHGCGPARVEALRGLDLTVEAGEFVAIMGTSGSGKSTLLHLLAGLDLPSSGSLKLGDADLATLNEDQRALLRRQRLGLVFQSFQLLDTLSAEENVALPLAIAGTPPAEVRERTLQALRWVGLEARRSHRPDQLSGGEQQRVAIARALVIDPLVLLADEPTGNLDSAQGDRIMDLLRRLVDERGQTLLMVTHDCRHAGRADRVLHLRDGKLVCDSAADSVPDSAEEENSTVWTIRIEPNQAALLTPLPPRKGGGGVFFVQPGPPPEEWPEPGREAA